MASLYILVLNYDFGIYQLSIIRNKIKKTSKMKSNYTFMQSISSLILIGFSFFSLVCTSNIVNAQTTDTYTTVGTENWVVPVGVTSITIECWAGGGGGGSANKPAGQVYNRGGGGGGGAYSSSTVLVTSGDNIEIVVGAGGSAGTPGNNNATAGGESRVSVNGGAPVVLAVGGARGQNGGGSAAGGNESSCVGTIKYSGGNGSAGVAGGSGYTSGAGGGGGGTNNPGENATNPNIGQSVPLGGAGGALYGGAGANGNRVTGGSGSITGWDGNVRGGGASGALAYSYSSGGLQSAAGGNGGRGEVRITYDASGGCDPQTANAGVSLASICQDETSESLNGSVGGSATTGVWSSNSGGTFTPNTNDLNATWTPAADYTGTATLTLTTTNGCDVNVSDDISITVNATYIISNPQTICEGDSYMINGNTYTAEDTYSDVFQSENGCDSTVMTILTFHEISLDTSVTVNGGTLTSVEEDATYQWIDCDNGNQAVVGETNQSFSPAVSGNYAVVLTSSICDSDVDTSYCNYVDLSNAGLNTLDNSWLKIYPNPSRDILNVETNGEKKITSIRITDLEGRLILVKDDVSITNQISIESFNNGVYYIALVTDEGITYQKFIKQ